MIAGIGTDLVEVSRIQESWIDLVMTLRAASWPNLKCKNLAKASNQRAS